MIGIKQSGGFKNTEKFLNRVTRKEFLCNLDEYGRLGVEALSSATPVDSGKTAASWQYRIVKGIGKTSIEWINTNEENGINVAVILQYGHATSNGSYVKGIDYINPALRPIFESIADLTWKEVTDK